MTLWTDNFDDNVFNPDLWEKIELKGGSVAEVNMRMELTTPTPTSSPSPEVVDLVYPSPVELPEFSTAGIVTRDRYDLMKGYMSAYLASVQGHHICLLISPEKTTTKRPLELSNLYAMILNKGKDNVLTILRIKDGAGEILYEAGWAAESNVLKIEIEAGMIRFWEGGNAVFSEVYQLATFECYGYIVSEGADPLVGTNWADDFACEHAYTPEEKETATREYESAKAARGSVEAVQKVGEWMVNNWYIAVPLGVVVTVLILYMVTGG